MAKGLLLSAALCALWAVVYLLIAHGLKPRKLFPLLTLLFLPTLPSLVGLYLMTPADLGLIPAAWSATPQALGLANGLLVHVLAYCTLMQFLYYVDRPVTLRMLVAFLDAPDGQLSLRALREACGQGPMIEARLQTMRLHGYLEAAPGRCRLTAKGRLFARAFLLLRRALGTPYHLDLSTPGNML